MPRSAFRPTPRLPRRPHVAAAVALAAALAAGVGAATTAAAPRPAAAAVVATSVSLFPVADAYIDQASPATNHNTATAWPVERDANGRERYPLLRFDTSAIPADATITAADLKVYLNSGTGDSPIHIIVERITLDWDQATVTWNNRPPTSGTWGSWDTDKDPGERTFDIRVLVGNWVRDSMPNHGLTLRGPTSGTYERLFRSTGTTRPHIDVVYTAPTATPSATPTASATATPTATPTWTPTPTPTPSNTPTATWTPSATPTATPSATPTPTPSSTPTPTPSITPTLTPSTTPTASSTAPATPGPGFTPSITPSASPTLEASTPTAVGATVTPTATLTLAPTATATAGGPSPTSPISGTFTPAPTAATPSATSVPSLTGTPTPTAAGTGVLGAHVYLPVSLRSAALADPNGSP